MRRMDAPGAAREALRSMGPLSRNERITAVVFGSMICAWIMGGALDLGNTAVAIAGLGVLLATKVLTLEDIQEQGGTLATFLWLAVLFALSGQLNEMGFMGYVGERLAMLLGDVSWPVAYTVLLCLYVLLHYLFVSQSAQVLALLGVFLDVGIQAGVPVHLMAFALLFASSYFSTLTPQGGSQNIIFVASGYLTQRELYRLGLSTTVFCLLVFLFMDTLDRVERIARYAWLWVRAACTGIAASDRSGRVPYSHFIKISETRFSDSVILRVSSCSSCSSW